MKALIVIAILIALSPVIGLYFSLIYSGVMYSLSKWQDGVMPDVPNNYSEE